MSTIPCIKTRQEYEEVLLLIAEIVAQRRFPSKLGLQVVDLNDQPFTLLFMLCLEFVKLAIIAAKAKGNYNVCLKNKEAITHVEQTCCCSLFVLAFWFSS